MRSIRRQLFKIVLGTAVFAAAFLGVAGPVSAHDSAESSSPGPGATVAVPPEKVSVTFNNSPQGIGARFSVKDASGAEWSDGPVEIVDKVASQQLRPGGPAGKYTVTWRVAGSDSHPLEGTFSFTATAGAVPGAAPPGGSTQGSSTQGSSTSGSSTAPAVVPSMGTARPGTTESPAPIADASQPFPWSLVVFAAVAIGLLVAIGLMAKRRLAGSEGPGAGSEGPGEEAG
jgi:methionine-rich copper-binding protein CopC